MKLFQKKDVKPIKYRGIAPDYMTDEEFEANIRAGIADAEAGRTYSAEQVHRELEERCLRTLGKRCEQI